MSFSNIDLAHTLEISKGFLGGFIGVLQDLATQFDQRPIAKKLLFTSILT